MPDLEWNSVVWNDPRNFPDGGDGWSMKWGGPRPQWYGAIFPRIAQWLPVARLLEIAPGEGRWTQFLLGQTNEYYGVDLSPRCVQQCRQRFAGFTKANFLQNDGKSLDALPDNSIDFIFSFDSLVHVERDVIEVYCTEINKKLNDFGVAFLHHSNALNVSNVEHSRATTVSSSAVKEIIEKTDGKVLIQEEVNWGGRERLDCMTTFCKKISPRNITYDLIQNDNFMNEAEMIRNSIGAYFKQ